VITVAVERVVVEPPNDATRLHAGDAISKRPQQVLPAQLPIVQVVQPGLTLKRDDPSLVIRHGRGQFFRRRSTTLHRAAEFHHSF
jgi:hypothetical protein